MIGAFRIFRVEDPSFSVPDANMSTNTKQMTLSPRTWGELFLLSFIWGGSFLSVRIALDEIGPLTSVAHRVGWAAVILWVYILLRRMALPKSPKVWIGLFGMGILNNVIPFSLMAWGQLYIETGLTSILNAATAIFTILAAALFFADEKLTTRRLIGVVLGFLGVSTAIGLSNLVQFDIRSLGQLAVVAGTISYAFAAVWARKMLKGLAPQVAAAGMLLSSTIVMVPMAWIVEGPISLSLQTDTWLAIIYYALVATAIAYLLYYHVLSLAGAGNLGLCTLLVAPVAIVLGAVVLGETLSSQAYVGFGMIATGLIILNTKPNT
jgi:drug/metabolite transporter (DMT)-like permease